MDNHNGLRITTSDTREFRTHDTCLRYSQVAIFTATNLYFCLTTTNLDSPNTNRRPASNPCTGCHIEHVHCSTESGHCCCCPTEDAHLDPPILDPLTHQHCIALHDRHARSRPPSPRSAVLLPINLLLRHQRLVPQSVLSSCSLTVPSSCSLTVPSSFYLTVSSNFYLTVPTE